ncbi:unnamed protein product [Owenia fusiformis]|uniref:Uncharacterized protein n=1 Tax=Owenia fusiformis TaxID=6347 RepID=A0A8S4N162_OWEFU|nr:unnamed protein product [Owenia fusiformis]
MRLQVYILIVVYTRSIFCDCGTQLENGGTCICFENNWRDTSGFSRRDGIADCPENTLLEGTVVSFDICQSECNGDTSCKAFGYNFFEWKCTKWNKPSSECPSMNLTSPHTNYYTKDSFNEDADVYGENTEKRCFLSSAVITKTHEEADTYCKAYGGRLATMTYDVTFYISQHPFQTLVNNPTVTTWTNGRLQYGNITWADGSTDGWTNWEAGEADLENTYGDDWCVVMKYSETAIGMQWRLAHCCEQHNLICEFVEEKCHYETHLYTVNTGGIARSSTRYNTFEECAQSCLDISVCSGARWNIIMKVCQRFSSSPPTGLISSSDYHMMFPSCPGSGDPCSSDPCQNAGTCHRGYGGSSYTCSCNKGFTGENCETSSGLCPEDWLYYGDACYHGFKGSSSWMNARSLCKENAANLVSMTSCDEYYFVEEIVKPRASLNDFWIGLQRKWNWTDGQQSQFKAWDINSAPSYGNGACAVLSHTNGKWFDQDCLTAANYICKKAGQSCDTGNGWSFYADGCYKKFFTSTFNDAEANCILENAHLVHVRNTDENQMLYTNFTSDNTDIWIGFFNTENYVWFDDSDITWWQDTAAIDTNYVCGISNSGIWKTQDCIATHDYICKQKLDPAFSTPEPTTVATTVATTTTTAVPTSVATTTPTTIPTTVSTTEPSTVLTTVASTVPTTFPILVAITVPSTFPSTVETTVPTTVPTTVETTEPTTVPTTVETTEPTTVPSTVETTEPTTTYTASGFVAVTTVKSSTTTIEPTTEIITESMTVTTFKPSTLPIAEPTTPTTIVSSTAQASARATNQTTKIVTESSPQQSVSTTKFDESTAFPTIIESKESQKLTRFLEKMLKERNEEKVYRPAKKMVFVPEEAKMAVAIGVPPIIVVIIILGLIFILDVPRVALDLVQAVKNIKRSLTSMFVK